MMRHRPQHAGRIIQVAVTLDVHDDAAVGGFLRSQAGAGARRSAVAHAAGTLASEIAVRLVHVEQTGGMTTGKTVGSRHANVFVLEQRPKFSVQSAKADGAAVPSTPRHL